MLTKNLRWPLNSKVTKVMKRTSCIFLLRLISSAEDYKEEYNSHKWVWVIYILVPSLDCRRSPKVFVYDTSTLYKYKSKLYIDWTDHPTMPSRPSSSAIRIQSLVDRVSSIIWAELQVFIYSKLYCIIMHAQVLQIKEMTMEVFCRTVPPTSCNL